MNAQLMPKAILFSLLIIFIFSSPQHARADGIGISPKRLVIQDNQRFADVTLVNSSNTRQRFETAIINKRMNNKGQLEDTTTPADGEFFADKMIRYTPRNVDIAPGQSQTVRVLSRLSDHAKDGEYRSHLLFKQMPNQTKNKALYAINIPVILLKGNLDASATLSNPRTFQENEKTFVTFDINRQGNKSLYGIVKILTSDTEIATLKGVATYLSTSKRSVTFEIPYGHSKSIHENNARIIFETDEQRAEIEF